MKKRVMVLMLSFLAIAAPVLAGDFLGARIFVPKKPSNLIPALKVSG